MQVRNLRYNQRDKAFEASVDVKRFGRMFRYPCALHGPKDMDHHAVIAGLQHKALQMSDTPI